MYLRLFCDFNWQQNPIIGIGNLVDVQLSINGNSTDMYMIRQELNYNGVLRGSSEFVGRLELQ